MAGAARDRCRGLGAASDAGEGASGRPTGEAVHGLKHRWLPFPVPGGKQQLTKSDGSLPRVSRGTPVTPVQFTVSVRAHPSQGSRGSRVGPQDDLY